MAARQPSGVSPPRRIIKPYESCFVNAAWPYANGPVISATSRGFGVPSDGLQRYERMKGK